jgi:RNA polymerase-binding transcription factor DksA
MAEAATTSPNGLSKMDVARIRLRLLALRTELEARRSDRDLLDLKRIESALSKMTRGGYGICESCSRPVVKVRLLEAPHVRYCGICSGARGAASSARGAAAGPSTSQTIA